MNNSTIRLYNLLISKNFNQEEAASFIEDVESTVTKKFEENINILTTKKDLAEVKQSLTDDLAEVRQELKKDISNLKQELKEEISGIRDTLHSTMINLFWKMTGLVLAQMGLIFVILKFVGVFE